MIESTQPIAFFDLETTGVNIGSDRIVEMAILRVNTDQTQDFKVYRINPGIPIPKEASQIHGIYDADVQGSPTFKQVAPEIQEFLQDAHLGGYNSNYFDVPLLVEEFYRAGMEFNMENRKMVDVLSIFKKMEQRNLSAAYRFYCNKELTNAHNAEADIRATYEILLAQLKKYDTLESDISFLHDFTTQSRFVDFEGKISRNEQGVETINFGKHKGKSIPELLKSDPSYFDWMLKQDFSSHTKKILSSLVKKYKS